MTRTHTGRNAGRIDTHTDRIARTTNIRVACLSVVMVILLVVKVMQ